MRSLRKPFAAAAVVGAAALAVAGCGSSSSSSSSTGSSSASTSTASNAANTSLGTVHKATGTPYVFGLINDETGPVTFPEARQAEIAAASYVNNYMGGINGHPIQLADCIGDTTAPTSARCANELVAKHPMAILGAADTGTPAAETVYARAGLAYLGGIPFTPVEQNAPNSVQFWSISLGDNAAASVYAAKSLGAKSADVLYFDNSQGKVAGLGVIPPVMKAAGITKVKTVGIPPTTPDPSSVVATVIADHPDVVYVDIPNNCGVVLKDLKSLGYTGKIVGIDPCTSPPAISSSAGAAQGMYVATPFQIGLPQFNTFVTALKKYGAPGTAIDGVSEAGFATVLNVRNALNTIKGTPTTKTILAAFKTGSNHPNYMSHPYTCDGQQVAKAVSVCDDHYLIAQVNGTQLVVAHPNAWVTSKGYFKGL
ncbi:MAG: ABC transporter substrate-binding protein [Solirubrobacteraceae bacterium]